MSPLNVFDCLDLLFSRLRSLDRSDACDFQLEKVDNSQIDYDRDAKYELYPLA